MDTQFFLKNFCRRVCSALKTQDTHFLFLFFPLSCLTPSELKTQPRGWIFRLMGRASINFSVQFCYRSTSFHRLRVVL